MNMCIFITELLCCLPETNTALQINYQVQVLHSVVSDSLRPSGL